MTKYELTAKVILNCISENVLEKSAIARELIAIHPDKFHSFEFARTYVREVLGSKGSRIPKKYEYVREAYMAKTGGADYEKARNRETIKARRYIITSAMNGTPVFAEFFQNILSYAEHLSAELYVVATRYKNPTSIFTDRSADIWAKEVIPYLDANRHDIHKYVSIMSDIKIQPTDNNPLSGVEGMSDIKSCIFGHPRVHMKFLPVFKNSKPKVMMTTGSVTLPNYTDSKSGAKGEFHHTYGFVIVEIKDDETFFIRQVTASSDGSFIDTGVQVKDGVISEAPAPLALDLGDIHTAKLTANSIARMSQIISEFNPPVVVMHDVFDGESVNPHEQNNPVCQYEKCINGKNDLASEIELTMSFLSTISSLVPRVVTTKSNHDDFLDRYIANMDWRKDIQNAETYAKLASVALSGNAKKGLFPYLVEERFDSVKCLDVDESFIVAGIELGNHGHIGANGSKGSPNQFRRLSAKQVTGHTHSPMRLDGCSVVGCQEMDHGYNIGMTNWWTSDVIINADGKRQHLIYFDNEYKLRD